MPSLVSGVPIGAAIVVLLFGSALLGVLFARLLPQHHLTTETKSVVSVSMAVVGTLAALVLGLLISTANTSFVTKSQEVAQIGSDSIRLDELLRRYGPDAQSVRMALQDYVAATDRDLFPVKGEQPVDVGDLTTLAGLEAIETGLAALSPTDDSHRWIRSEALRIGDGLADAGWKLKQDNDSRTPFALMVLVVFWFGIVFASFGLFAPVNATAFVAMFLCSVGVGVAIRMTTDLQTPFQGLIRISSVPLARALDTIRR